MHLSSRLLCLPKQLHSAQGHLRLGRYGKGYAEPSCCVGLSLRHVDKLFWPLLVINFHWTQSLPWTMRERYPVVYGVVPRTPANPIDPRNLDLQQCPISQPVDHSGTMLLYHKNCLLQPEVPHYVDSQWLLPRVLPDHWLSSVLSSRIMDSKFNALILHQKCIYK